VRGVRRQQLRTVETFLDEVLALREWLPAEQVTEVAMAATGSYRKPFGYVRGSFMSQSSSSTVSTRISTSPAFSKSWMTGSSGVCSR
jgi:hypothetical protein